MCVCERERERVCVCVCDEDSTFNYIHHLYLLLNYIRRLPRRTASQRWSPLAHDSTFGPIRVTILVPPLSCPPYVRNVVRMTCVCVGGWGFMKAKTISVTVISNLHPSLSPRRRRRQFSRPVQGAGWAVAAGTHTLTFSLTH